MNARWVIGTYTGKQATVVKAHAENGIGYRIIQEYGKGAGLEVTAAFKRPEDRPLPAHLQYASDSQVAKLDAPRR